MCVLVAPLGARAGDGSIRVGDEEQFSAAVSALRDRGGTILLLPHAYRGDLVVSSRSLHLLRIVGDSGVRVQRMLLDHTQHVAVSNVTISPLGQDASIEIHASSHVDLQDVVVTAAGTRRSASVHVPDSSYVTVRRSEFEHCGDRSPTWSNCLLLEPGARHVTVEDSWFHDCFGCDFVHGRFGFDLVLRRNRFERSLPCSLDVVRCGHQDLIELFAGRKLRVEGNRFGVYKVGGAQLYLTGVMSDVRVANNLFLATDPKVPRYRARVGLIIGSRGAVDVPRYVSVVNNTILSGAVRKDGYAGSIRMSSVYTWRVPRRERPVLANNVIGLLTFPGHVCSEARSSVSNLVVRGHRCRSSDQVGSPHLDARGRPTAASTLLIDRASRRYAPRLDITGRPRGSRPDIGAYEYASATKHSGRRN